MGAAARSASRRRTLVVLLGGPAVVVIRARAADHDARLAPRSGGHRVACRHVRIGRQARVAEDDLFRLRPALHQATETVRVLDHRQRGRAAVLLAPHGPHRDGLRAFGERREVVEERGARLTRGISLAAAAGNADALE